MEERKKKVVAAITAAVYSYMAEQQAQLEAQRKQAEMPPMMFSPWVMSGRAAAMEMRRSWQMRLVR